MKFCFLAFPGIAALTLTSCQAIKDVPITVAYKTDVAGHDLTSAYSNKDGLVLYGQKRRAVSPQK